MKGMGELLYHKN